MSARRERLAAVATVGLLILAVLAAGTGQSQSAAAEPTVPTPPAADGPGPYERPTADGVARVDGERYVTIGAALEAADPGDRIAVRGRFAEHVTVRTPNVTVAAPRIGAAVLSGRGEGEVLTVAAPGVTIERLWVADSGWRAAANDAGVWVDADHVTLASLRVTNVTFGVWLDGVDDATVANATIVGRPSVSPRTRRGNGVQIWHTTDSEIRDSRITDVRDGLYYSWASDVRAANNTLWDLRYGVHYMYSDSCVLANNTAARNDVGFALMVSENLTVANNTAVANRGRSGHGVLLKSIDRSTIRGNHLLANGNGIYLYNSLHNEVSYNLIADNEVGVHVAAGSVRERVHHNSFLRNDAAVYAVLGEEVVWNGSVGNYWAGASVADVDGDGVGERSHRPAGRVERMLATTPALAAFTASPAFEALATAARAIPLIDQRGVVDRRPLATPVHDDWRSYYDRDNL